MLEIKAWNNFTLQFNLCLGGFLNYSNFQNKIFIPISIFMTFLHYIGIFLIYLYQCYTKNGINNVKIPYKANFGILYNYFGSI